MFDQLFEDYKNNHYNYLMIEQNVQSLILIIVFKMDRICIKIFAILQRGRKFSYKIKYTN